MREFARGISGGVNEGWLRRRAAELGLAVALAPIFTWVGPFGLEADPVLARLGFWCGLLASWFIVTARTELCLTRNVQLGNLDSRARRVVVVALSAVAMIPITAAAIDALNGWEASVAEVSELYFQILVVGSVVTMLGDRLVPILLREAEPWRVPAPVAALPALADARPAATSPASPLIARLPPDLRGPVLCLEMQDHYVRVHTGRGSALVLMRLRDAIAETSPIAGRQVHRSWWVAKAAVERFERAGRTGSLLLKDGRRVPVSQRYLQDVEEAWGNEG